MPDLLVSVLTPSFNQGRWISRNLASVAGQTYKRVEHVVMDGGSTDETRAVLRSNARPGLLWCSEPDSGQSDALNKALRASHGDIIGWLNSDDAYFRPDAIQRVVDVFASDPAVDVLYGHAALINVRDELLQFLWVPPFNASLLRFTNFIIQPSVFIRRECLDERMADEGYEGAMDRELWLRLVANGAGFRRAPFVLAADRHYVQRKALNQSLMLEDMRRLAGQYGLKWDYRLSGLRALVRLTFRAVGVGRVFSDDYASRFKAFRSDGRLRLVSRQLFARRRRMPGTNAVLDG